MKVNISGKGVIPFVNKVAPQYNIEVSETIIKKLLKYPKFGIYASEGFGKITEATFEKPTPIAQAVAEATPIVEKKKPSRKPKKTADIKKEEVPVEEVPKVEETKPEVVPYLTEPEEIVEVETPVEFTEEVEGEAIEEDLEEVSEGEDVASEEESTEEEAPKQTSKKKKKNRNK